MVAETQINLENARDVIVGAIIASVGVIGPSSASIWISDVSDQTAPPIDMGIEWNNTSQESSTELFLDINDITGEDVRVFFELLTVGTRIRLQSIDSAISTQIFRIISITDNTTYFTFGVENLFANGGNIPDATNVIVTFIIPLSLPDHGVEHLSDGQDPIPSATTSVGGLLSAPDKTKLDGIETGATADQSDVEIETAYNNQVSIVSQAEAEAGTSSTVRRWTAERVAQAIAALESGGAVDSVNGQTGDVVLDMDDFAETATNKILTAAERTSISTAEQTANKGANNGYAPLDSSAIVPLANLPASVKTGSEYKGVYNATTNTPTLVNGTGSNGDYHRVNVAGTQDFGAGSITFFVGDLVVFDGVTTLWERSAGNPDLVQSVAGKQGVVTLDMDDLSETATGKIFSDVERTNLGNQSGTNTGDEPDATTTIKGIVELATDGENAANVVVQGNDARLSDDRNPTAHTIASHSDTTATGAELETLTDGSNADALHTHAGLGVGELPAVQACRTTNLALTGSWSDVTMDSTPTENNATVVEHNNTNTERIDIKETGLYSVGYNIVVNAGTSGDFSFRIFKNGTTRIECTMASSSETDDGSGDRTVSNWVPVELTAGDFITLQAIENSGSGVLQGDSVNLHAVRLQGAKGDKGDTGDTGPVGGGGQTNTVVGSSGITNVGDNVNADLAPTYGSAANTICEGDDARLSDDRTADGIRTATTVVAVSAATAPTLGQVLTATSSTAADWQDPSGGGGGGSHLGSFNANDALFPSSNPAVADSRNSHPLLAFDDVTAENVVFSSLMSEDYSGGDISIDIDWVAETATSGGVTWGIEIERNAASGNDIDSDSFAAQQTSNSTTNGTSGVITKTTITLTQAQADSITAGDSYRMRLQRVTGDGGDNMTNDAQVLNIAVRQ